jgi:hypothetical protein
MAGEISRLDYKPKTSDSHQTISGHISEAIDIKAVQARSLQDISPTITK